MTSDSVVISQDGPETRENGLAEARQLRFLELLAASAADLLDANDLGSALDRLFRMIRTELKLDVFFHYSYDEDAGLDLAAHGGLTADEAEAGARIQVGEAVCGWVAQHRKPLIASHVQDSIEAHDAFARRMGLDAYVCTPLLHAGKLLGTLAFGRRGTLSFDETEVRFLQTLSSYVALAKHRIGTDDALRAGIAERERLLAERGDMERRVIELTRAGALGAIAATIAHELNQPLSAAANYLSAIRLDADPTADATRERAAAAEAQLQRAGEIIRRIRRMVSHEDLTLEVHLLKPIITEAINLVGAAAPGQLPLFRIEIGDAASRAMVDHVQLVQILATLLRNAAEATESADGSLVIVETRARSADEIEIRVIDNGPGVAADIREALFQPGLGTSSSGLGVGLAISRNLVEAHGGTIRVEDTPGGGATFCFTLPAVAAY
ncbi:GAF domain-containing protein [Sphingomonas sp. JC676]|uniref:sensor histidine kinase n=1 Tax=Sphingomonas sp. JC676 TaxID=2768065 RepID=UPI001658489E|nr:ATP-binding protein [Sphingomonas sp. JC676]MBC9032382.1 GAF domain-containing protein [Sphingomonas sp. JC676]